MKQHKTPLLLVTIVATMVVVLVGVNMSQYLRDPNRIKEQPRPDPDTIVAVRPVPEDAKIEDIMGAPNTRPYGTDSLVAVGEVPVNPSIKLRRLQSRREQFRTELPSAHWWENKSNQHKTSEDRARLYQRSQK